MSTFTHFKLFGPDVPQMHVEESRRSPHSQGGATDYPAETSAPISLTSTLGKVLERFVSSWILDLVRDGSILISLEQCADPPLHMHSSDLFTCGRRHFIQRVAIVKVLFLDFSKVFDCVDIQFYSGSFST